MGYSLATRSMITSSIKELLICFVLFLLGVLQSQPCNGIMIYFKLDFTEF